MTAPHTHRCEACSTPVPCDGDWELNHDGWPEVICRIYHTGRSPWLCPRCQEAADDE